MKLLLITLIHQSILYSTRWSQATASDVTVIPTPNVTLMAGSSFVLTCQVSNITAAPDIEWIGPNGNSIEMTMTDDLVVMTDTNWSNSSMTTKLNFSSVRTSQAGVYSCKVNFTEQPEIVEKTARIYVKVPDPSVTLLWSRTEPFYEGTELSLLCIIHFNGMGIDTPFSLERLLSSHMYNDSRKTLGENTTDNTTVLQLIIMPLGMVDEGMYTCSAHLKPSPLTNFVLSSKRIEQSLNLSVSGLPSPLIEISQSAIAVIGQSETLTCSVTVIEQLQVEPLIYWTNSEGEVLTAQESVTNTETMYQVTLTFQQLFASQIGQYICIAQFDIPSIEIYNYSTSALIDLSAHLPPPLIQLSTDPIAYHGANHTFNCSLSVDSSVDVAVNVEFEWSIIPSLSTGMPASPLVQSQFVEIQNFLDHSVLKLTPVRESSLTSGTYKCHVQVSAENAINSIIPSVDFVTTDVTVREPPAPIVSFDISRTSSLCSEISSIRCSGRLEINIVFSLNVSWVNLANQHNEGDTITFENISMDNVGFFICVACVNHLEDLCGVSEPVSITTETPRAVEDLTCHYTGDETSLGLTWTHNSSSILEYLVEVQQYILREGFEDRVITVEPLYPPFKTEPPAASVVAQLITGLERGTRYVLTVTGVSAIRCGEAQSMICYSEEDVPQVVSQVFVDRIDATRMNVSWAPLDAIKARGIITQYLVYYTMVQRSTVVKRNLNLKVVAPDESHTVIDGLEAASQYQVQVVAQNRMGRSNLDETPVISVGIYPTSDQSLQTSAIVGGIVGGVLVVALGLFTIIVIAGLVFKYKINIQRSATINTYSDQRPRLPSETPVPFYSLPNNYDRGYYDDTLGLTMCPQYEDIEKFQPTPADYEVARSTSTLAKPISEEQEDQGDSVEIEISFGYENPLAIEDESDSLTESSNSTNES